MFFAFNSNGINFELSQIASQTIVRSEEIQDSGANVITYENLDLFINMARNISFTPLTPTCDYCSGRSSDDKYFNAAIRYGVITTTTCNIQASYWHKTFGLSNVSVGLSATGMPKISVGIGSTITVYNARAVTLK